MSTSDDAEKLSDAFDPRSELDFAEDPVNFDAIHYKNGLNGDFMPSDADAAAVMAKYGAVVGGKFEDPELREIARNLDSVVALFLSSMALSSIGSAPVICDVGAGTGLFLKALSAASSTLYAADISEHFRIGLRERCKEEGLSNVQVVSSTSRTLDVPPESIDLAVMVDVYHHLDCESNRHQPNPHTTLTPNSKANCLPQTPPFPTTLARFASLRFSRPADPLTMCRQIRRALKKNGRFVVLDFHRDESIYERTKSHEPGWVTAHVRMTQDEARQEILSCGFRMVSEPVIPELEENYIFVLEPLQDEELTRPGQGWAN